jgi:hypothetical protein
MASIAGIGAQMLAATNARHLALAPLFFRSVGLGSTDSFAIGTLNMAPSMLCHRQVIPSIWSYSASPAFHKASNTSVLQFEESLVDCAGAAKALFGKCLPLATGAQHVDDGLEDLSRRLWWSLSVRFSQVLFTCHPLSYRDQWFDSLPEIISHHPRLNSLSCCHAFARTPRELQLGTRVYYSRINSKAIWRQECATSRHSVA